MPQDSPGIVEVLENVVTEEDVEGLRLPGQLLLLCGTDHYLVVLLTGDVGELRGELQSRKPGRATRSKGIGGGPFSAPNVENRAERRIQQAYHWFSRLPAVREVSSNQQVETFAVGSPALRSRHGDI